MAKRSIDENYVYNLLKQKYFNPYNDESNESDDIPLTNFKYK